MAYSVTSWFIDQTYVKNPDNLVRKFTIGSSDFSDRVSKWPSFKQTWNEIKPVNLTIELSNEDGGMNFIRDETTILVSSSSVSFGFSHPDSGDELINLFTGTIEYVRYSRGSAFVAMFDKFKKLTERVVGTSDVPVSFTTSNYLPSDLAWWLITSYGGFSTTADSSNADINYDEWLTWSNVFSNDAVFVNAQFDGQKVSECLRKIGRITRSAIFIKEDKITFHRFSVVDSNTVELDNDSILKLDLTLDDKDTVNKQYVFADYAPASDYWQTTVFDVSTSSVNSYGLKEDTEKDKVTWYVGSGPALNAAARIKETNDVPSDQISVDTTLVGVMGLVGQTVSVVDSFHGLNHGFRIMSNKVDVDKGIVSFTADRSQWLESFILDTSTLNSTATLT